MAFKSTTLAAIAAVSHAIKSSTNLQSVGSISDGPPPVDPLLTTRDTQQTIDT